MGGLDLARLQTGERLISTFDVNQISPEELLFQTGYLTILHEKKQPAGNQLYTLGYPNHEVAICLNDSLLATYTADPSKSERQRNRLAQALLCNDVPAVQQVVESFFAGSPDHSIPQERLPHHWFDNNPIARYEGYYASVFYSYFVAMGYDCRVEDATNHGRIDMVLLIPPSKFGYLNSRWWNCSRKAGRWRSCSKKPMPTNTAHTACRFAWSAWNFPARKGMCWLFMWRTAIQMLRRSRLLHRAQIQ